jgi:hypothetical protein
MSIGDFNRFPFGLDQPLVQGKVMDDQPKNRFV